MRVEAKFRPTADPSGNLIGYLAGVRNATDIVAAVASDSFATGPADAPGGQWMPDQPIELSAGPATTADTAWRSFRLPIRASPNPGSSSGTSRLLPTSKICQQTFCRARRKR